MRYTINEIATIKRPIFFLCGPYYEPNNPEDRRKILKEFFYNRCDSKVLPLVIDDFLTKENIKDDTIDIKLMEEICSSVSASTYIFLDTMSAATELGIFSNSAFAAPIMVMIPKYSDIISKDNVGTFVRDSVLQPVANDNVSVLTYRPSIKYCAKATNYFSEYYYFPNACVPQNIKDYIEEQISSMSNSKFDVTTKEGISTPDSLFQICYDVKDNRLDISISIKLFFYLTVSIVELLYENELRKRIRDFSIFNITSIQENIHDVIRNYFSGIRKEKLNNKEVHIQTVLKVDESILIRHFVKFVHVFNIYGKEKVRIILPNPKNAFLKELPNLFYPNDIFSLDDKEWELIENINNDKDSFFENKEIKGKSGKRRVITKYKDTIKGKEARELHKKIQSKIIERYSFHDSSYAYKKKSGIKDCVSQHLWSRGFVKHDIRHFFNSIDKKKLIECLRDVLNIDSRFIEQIEKIIDSCYYDGKLPLGLVTSPVLSDIYLHSVDLEMSRYALAEGLVYTRYADDILISSKEAISEEKAGKISNRIASLLGRKKLSLNRKKYQLINFGSKAHFVRYLGINLIDCGEIECELSVGRRYINTLAKELLNYCREANANVSASKSDVINYKKTKIIGHLGFLKLIEGPDGLEKLDRRIKKYDGVIPGIKEFLETGKLE